MCTLGCLFPFLVPGASALAQVTTDATIEDDLADVLLEAAETGGRKHRIAGSVDYLFGLGDVSLPRLYSLQQQGGFDDVTPSFRSSSRKSDYVGATVSYAWKNRVFVDASYILGSTKDEEEIEFLLDNMKADYELEDAWYQLHMRVMLTKPGARLGSYARFGVSYVDGEGSSFSQGSGGLPYDYYHRDTHWKDVFGSVGVGLSYDLAGSLRYAVLLQVEGEGFYGRRGQTIEERLGSARGPEVDMPTADLYGGQVRFTVGIDAVPFASVDALRLYLDVGVQARYTEVRYPTDSALSYSGSPDGAKFEGITVNELLWGPYVKLGLKYTF